jgi:hypothetical protein
MEFQTPEDTVPSELITEELSRQLVGKPKATGAWRDGDPAGDRSFANLGNLTLESGKELHQAKLAFETWGTLNKDSSNAVLVLHALTGDSHAVGKSSKDINIAMLEPALSPSTQVTKIKINNAGSFLLQIQSPKTKNFNAWSLDNPLYISIPQLTPTITFLTKVLPSLEYGNNPYTFTPATITNSDPSQIITYSITTVYSQNPPPIGSFDDNTIPSITINSVGNVLAKLFSELLILTIAPSNLAKSVFFVSIKIGTEVV